MTPNEDLESRVRRVAADIFGLSPVQVRADSSPETIEAWDSIKHLELVLALEQEFDLAVDPDEIAEMQDIGRIVQLLSGR